jgi:tetraacyldisaccharide 4'-kinase
LAQRIPLPADRFVVSIGNLRLGGTGKTPVVRDLALSLKQSGRSGVILCRGYGSQRTEACIVEVDDRACGDEARMLARDTGWTVVQASNRIQGWELAHQVTTDGDVVLIEDGFQTAGVSRHCDLLIVDQWTQQEDRLVPQTGHLLPWGPYREHAQAAVRANAVLVEVFGEYQVPATTLDGQPVYAFRRQPVLAPERLPQGRYGVVSGLARPKGFEKACAELCGGAASVLVRYDDHVSYDVSAVNRLSTLGSERKLDAWLTTAKDSIKLAGIWNGPTPLLEVGLELSWLGDHPGTLWTKEQDTP